MEEKGGEGEMEEDMWNRTENGAGAKDETWLATLSASLLC